MSKNFNMFFFLLYFFKLKFLATNFHEIFEFDLLKNQTNLQLVTMNFLVKHLVFK